MQDLLKSQAPTWNPPTEFIDPVDLNTGLLLEKADIELKRNPPWPNSNRVTVSNTFHRGGVHLTGINLVSTTLYGTNNESLTLLEGTRTIFSTCSADSISIMGSVAENPEIWERDSWTIHPYQKATVHTGARSSTSASVRSLRELLKEKTREERLQKMASNKLDLYSDILKLRERIGQIDFDIVEAVRSLRKDA